MKAINCLSRLEKIKTVFDTKKASEKLHLLSMLQRRRLANAEQIKHLHDLICFIYVYPDNKAVFQMASDMLTSFARRSDLNAHKAKLINSGMAGTAVHYQFYWPMACWLAENCADNFKILWDEIEDTHDLSKILPLLVSPAETGLIDEFDFDAREWLLRLKTPAETDAVFFIKRLQNTYATDHEREFTHDELNLYYKLEPGLDTPDISNSTYRKSPICYQTGPLHSQRPSLNTALANTHFKIKKQTHREGKLLVDLARKTMLTHERDLDSFSYGNHADVRLVDFGDGYQIACIGMLPQRRYLLHSTYGFLNLKNGLPIGYFQISGVFNYADIAFNLFTPFRGGEASHIFTRNLAVAHQVFEMNSFNLDPYQLGHGNTEGLKSGVWWFYFKLGFRPMDDDIQNLLKRELNKIKKTSAYRSSLTTLDKLASVNMFYSLDKKISGYHRLANIGYVLIGISNYLAARFGASREAGLKTCVKEVLALTGKRSTTRSKENDLTSWLRWSALIQSIGGVSKWSVTERRQLGELIHARGKEDELEYLKMINRHKRLKKSILAFVRRLSE